MLNKYQNKEMFCIQLFNTYTLARQLTSIISNQYRYLQKIAFLIQKVVDGFTSDPVISISDPDPVNMYRICPHLLDTQQAF
jgi:hypothetical protein